MPLITCPDCGKSVSDSATSCPQCGCVRAAGNTPTVPSSSPAGAGTLFCSKCRTTPLPESMICPKCGSINISRTEIYQWSRHYDIIQWTVMTVLTASAVALATNDKNEKNLPLNIGGLLLVALSASTMFSFRGFRRNLNSLLPKIDKSLTRNATWLPQIVVNTFVHALFASYWLWRIQDITKLCCLWSVGSGMIFITFAVWAVETISKHSKTKHRPDPTEQI